jgi:hypothetical protein
MLPHPVPVLEAVVFIPVVFMSLFLDEVLCPEWALLIPWCPCTLLFALVTKDGVEGPAEPRYQMDTNAHSKNPGGAYTCGICNTSIFPLPKSLNSEPHAC